jgi:hypothetical protein
VTAKRIAALLSVCVLAGILTLGLWPFRPPHNDAAWLRNEDGLRFSGYGTAFSAESFQPDGLRENASTLELWMQPGLTFDTSTILAFSTVENPLQFSLHQYRSDLVLKRQVHRSKTITTIARVEQIFDSAKPIFIAITSSPKKMAIYVDGRVRKSAPGFGPDASFSGRLVIGTSPVKTDGWLGKLTRIAVYDRELTEEQVLEDFYCSSTCVAPGAQKTSGLAALYLFQERAGNIVHNVAGARCDLQIPTRFELIREPLFKPFWREASFTWDYVRDILVNIVGFIPLGFCIYATFALSRANKSPLAATVLFGLAVSLTIELLQAYLPTRNSGTTDLFTNTLGTFLGAALHRLPAMKTLLSKLS